MTFSQLYTSNYLQEHNPIFNTTFIKSVAVKLLHKRWRRSLQVLLVLQIVLRCQPKGNDVEVVLLIV